MLVCCYLLLVEDQSGPIGPTHSHLGKQTEELSAFVYINNDLGMNDHFLASNLPTDASDLCCPLLDALPEKDC